MRIDQKFKKIVNKETLLYGIVGVGTAILNIVMFKLLLLTKLDYRMANIITIVVTKTAAYICNKKIVFKSHCADKAELMAEIGRFIVYRGLSGVIDYFGVIALVVIGMKEFDSKLVVAVGVIILNYITGKKAVFLNVYGGNKHAKQYNQE